MTPAVNVNEHRTYTNLLHILHNRLSEEIQSLCWLS